jgi:hypothetical protein
MSSDEIRTKPALETPGRHELITLIVLFLSGSCAILTQITGYALIGAVLLMAVGVAGIWRSRSWSKRTKSFSTGLLLLLYFSLAIVAVISVGVGIGPPGLGLLYRIAILGLVFGVPAGIGAWVMLVFKTLLARSTARPGDQNVAAA